MKKKDLEDNSKPLPIMIKAMFGMVLVVPEENVSNDRIQKMATYICYPYWAELSKSMCVRMGLPPYPVLHQQLPEVKD